MQMPLERNPDDAYAIGQRIRRRREELRLSQDDLADRMGTSRAAVSRHENGNHEMSACTLCLYADALETSPQELSPARFRESGTFSALFASLSEPSRQLVADMMLRLRSLESGA